MMSTTTSYAHDLERTNEQWLGLLGDHSSLPVLERAYRSVVILLLTAGLRGLADVKTEKIAELSGITESTLFRYIGKREQLVADALDWCWEQLNRRIADAHLRRALIGGSAKDLILLDLETILGMYSDPSTKLYASGALLSFRRAEQLVGGFEPVSQNAFRVRLKTLCEALTKDCSDEDKNPDLISTYLINYIATIWFTWLSDINTKGPDGLLGVEMVLDHLNRTLDTFSSCRSRQYNNS
jgi:AcrR family transcriptional regulator